MIADVVFAMNSNFSLVTKPKMVKRLAAGYMVEGSMLLLALLIQAVLIYAKRTGRKFAAIENFYNIF